MTRPFRSTPFRLLPLGLGLALAVWAAGPTIAKPSSSTAETATRQQLTPVDLMCFHTIEGAVVAENGSWIAFEATPDRGDGHVVVRSTDESSTYTIERGSAPALTPNGRYAAAKVQPTFAEREAAKDSDGDKDDDGPTDGLTLLDTRDGSTVTFERVSAFAFSGDGAWLAVHHLADADTDDEATEAEGEGEATSEASEAESEAAESEAAESEAAEATDDEPEAADRTGTTLRLRRLTDGAEIEIADVEHLAFDATGAFVAVAHARADSDNRLTVHDLTADGNTLAPAIDVTAAERARYTALVWTSDDAETPALAFVAAVDDEEGEPGDGEIWLWDGARRAGAVAVAMDWPSDPGPEADGAAWQVPSDNTLAFSLDGDRLFFGTRPRPESDDEATDDDATSETEASAEGDEEGDEETEETEETEEPADPYDTEAILDEATVDVWHTADPLIKTNERQNWHDNEKDRTYLAVHHRTADKTVQLADRHVREVRLDADSSAAALASSAVPYLRERTWDGFYVDLYRVDLQDGSKQQIVERLADPSASLSPDGRYTAFWNDRQWHLHDAVSGATRSLTDALDVPFADEIHDYPAPVPGYDRPIWFADSSGFVLHDRYDLWTFPIDGEPSRRTDGRADETVFRIVDLDQDRPFVLDPAGRHLIEGYNDRDKNDGFWQLDLSSGTLRPLVEEAKRFDILAKAEDADTILYTRESYCEFPDLWVATTTLGDARKLSNVNPQIADYAWGQAELIDFTTHDGVELEGVLIRPDALTDAALEAGERCPVMVYYYRYFSQRLHLFNEPVVNHRPSFPIYASDGYCVFLPDVVFEIGRPGHSAVQSVVAGVQELVRRGIADPERLGLHGHSWSGYQTAHVVTQTDLFAAAVAGAPVTNMTSAYGGIRYRTGLARQFQYEKTQSRLGVSLWEGRDRYIENSPLFYADRIETPLLMMFGDEDGAVPWTQGIELYLALRRLDKHAVLLQYRGEGHHLRQYGNKLDYAIKMKEFFDHYLKDAPAPTWWSEGVPYRGDD
ncbi:MAG: prolyl oligopeptidase family serine peptidase [Acidobacteriota bacterium]